MLAQESVAEEEAAQSVFTAEDVKPAVIDFFFAEPRRLKNPNR